VKAPEDGVCAVCGRPYVKGQDVRANPDDRSKLAHTICGRRAARAKRHKDQGL
jgi:hypothetical protein